jgi:uncharacterized membrane protein
MKYLKLLIFTTALMILGFGLMFAGHITGEQELGRFTLTFIPICILINLAWILLLFRQKRKKPELLKQADIAMKDERTLIMMRHAGFIAFVISSVTCPLMAAVFLALDYTVPFIIAISVTGFNYLCCIGILLYFSYKKY